MRKKAPPPFGFRAVRVIVVVGEWRWQTSLFARVAPAPVKQQVRRANDLLPGRRVCVSLTVG